MENRRLTEKFGAALAMLKNPFKRDMPEAASTSGCARPIDDAEFVRRLYAEANVLGLPGSYLARTSTGKTREGTACGSRSSRRSRNASKRRAFRITQFARQL